MKSRMLILSAIIGSMLFLASCGDEDKSTPMEKIEGISKNIDKIEERSNEINNPEEAFTILQDLNNELKGLRDASMALDEKHRDIDPVAAKGETIDEDEQIEHSDEFEKDMQKFDEITDDINSSLKIISKNVKPYKDDPEVKKMMEKVETIMITK
ncbi:MAG: hypothetical protein ACOCPM_03185 [Bacteroidales bacterium]